MSPQFSMLCPLSLLMPSRMFQPLALVYQRVAGCHVSSFSPALTGKVLGWPGCGPRYYLSAPVPAGHHICRSSAAGVHASLFTHTTQWTNWTGHIHTLTENGWASCWNRGTHTHTLFVDYQCLGLIYHSAECFLADMYNINNTISLLLISVAWQISF